MAALYEENSLPPDYDESEGDENIEDIPPPDYDDFNSVSIVDMNSAPMSNATRSILAGPGPNTPSSPQPVTSTTDTRSVVNTGPSAAAISGPTGPNVVVNCAAHMVTSHEITKATSPGQKLIVNDGPTKTSQFDPKKNSVLQLAITSETTKTVVNGPALVASANHISNPTTATPASKLDSGSRAITQDIHAPPSLTASNLTSTVQHVQATTLDCPAGNTQPQNNFPRSCISAEEARSAMLEHCEKHRFCYGNKAATEMTIANLESSTAYHYSLQTFSEERSTRWIEEPYRGQPIDTSANGPAPKMWEVVVFPKEKFRKEKRKLPVPHTDSVRTCENCRGKGRVTCPSCHGSGSTTVSCSSCRGSGTFVDHYNGLRSNCADCRGKGYSKSTCPSCGGSGKKTCSLCKGYGQLLTYLQLKIKWLTHLDEYVLGRNEMPPKLIKKATGDTVVDQEAPSVFPIRNCLEASVNTASEQFVAEIFTKFPNQRTRLQRQILRIVPVTKATSAWKEKPFLFYIYGKEHRVYTDDYPQRCCSCQCAIF